MRFGQQVHDTEALWLKQMGRPLQHREIIRLANMVHEFAHQVHVIQQGGVSNFTKVTQQMFSGGQGFGEHGLLQEVCLDYYGSAEYALLQVSFRCLDSVRIPRASFPTVLAGTEYLPVSRQRFVKLR